MNVVEVTQTVLAAMDAGDWERARSHLADDFIFDGAVPQPIGPDAWLGVHKAFAAAMPDFEINPRGFHDEGGKAVGTVQLAGTQTQELALPVPGIAPIAPTGRRVALPAEPMTTTARDGKLVSITVSAVAGGGLPGLLAQLGVAMPAH